MFNQCILCGDFFGSDAVKKNYLHKLGKNMVCYNCLAGLRGAIGYDTIMQDIDNAEGKSHTKDNFAV
jgi:hypothetical protein